MADARLGVSFGHGNINAAPTVPYDESNDAGTYAPDGTIVMLGATYRR